MLHGLIALLPMDFPTIAIALAAVSCLLLLVSWIFTR